MNIIAENEIQGLVTSDLWMMRVLKAAEELGLPDWWIGAGFLRNKIWDYIQGNSYSKTRDVDLVYFDAKNILSETDKNYDLYMKNKFPFAEWEVRNQARMHYKNNLQPFSSTADGIAHWVETATCVAVKSDDNKLKFLFCHGTDDLFSLIARPIPIYQNPEHIKIFHDRVTAKNWREKWPNLQVISS